MHSSPNRNRARRANYGFPTLPYSTVADEDQAVQSLVVPKPTSSTQEIVVTRSAGCAVPGRTMPGPAAVRILILVRADLMELQSALPRLRSLPTSCFQRPRREDGGIRLGDARLGVVVTFDLAHAHAAAVGAGGRRVGEHARGPGRPALRRRLWQEHRHEACASMPRWESAGMNGPPDEFVLELKCVLDAAPERIFSTLTEPAELARWWGPRGFTTPEIELDLRVGGSYRFAMQPPDGDLFHLAGEFLEIDRPSRLVYTFRWEEPDPDDRETVVRLSLRPVVDATELSLWQGEFATEARVALHRSGWTESLEKLRARINSAA